MSARIVSFEPIAISSARILILGSMPGEASLKAGQYYAHTRNTFWKIMGELIGFDPQAPYAQRVAALKLAGIALWDVLHSCYREGSLDSAIKNDSIVVNDFNAFLAQHPHITSVCFNGAAAAQCYQKHVLPTCKHTAIHYTRLPSTSPAHAALSFEQKVMAWRAAIDTAHAMHD